MPIIPKYEECENFATLLYRGLDDRNERDSSKGDSVLWTRVAERGQDILSSQRDLLTALDRRQQAALEDLGKAGSSRLTLRAEVDWRLLIGLSYGRVWNMSLQVHPLYGCPFIPASAVKGALSHFAEDEGLALSSNPDFIAKDRRGAVTFFDAFGIAPEKENPSNKNGEPESEPFFEEDVVTPHYGDYYLDGSDYPADYIDPVPVPMLAVAGGVVFRFRLACRDETLLDETAKALKDCLEKYGLGAKTRRGYGLFKNVEEE